MKADNTSTPHNRTIRLTEIEGGELSELDITINYTKVPNDDKVVYKAVTLDGVVIPALIKAINDQHEANAAGRGAIPRTEDQTQ